MTLSAVAICNLALDELPAKPIVSLDDTTISAETCLRQFPQALGELMEDGEWNFGIRRVTLTAVTNTRTGFWRYQFQAPNDLAFPLRLVPADYANIGFVGGASIPDIGTYFDFEGATVWANSEAVTLEYITTTPEFSGMSKKFERALALTLASRLVMPILRDPQRKTQLLQEAEVFRERALAKSVNRNQNTYGDNFVPSSLRGYGSDEVRADVYLGSSANAPTGNTGL